MRRALLGLAALTLGACTADYGANPTPRCTIDTDCTGGATCHRGFCVGGTGGNCTEENASRDCPELATDVGNCVVGSQTCRGGMWSECTGHVGPEATDPCGNGDQDCDEMVDEDLVATCRTTGVGVCGDGMPGCASGAETCTVVNEPVVETCDGRDQDCDGPIDEDVTLACYPAMPGCTTSDGVTFACTGTCAPGHIDCVSGAQTDCLDPITPLAEVCDQPIAFDDNCDGTIDEGCSCTGVETQDCYPGPASAIGFGGCTMGTQTCTGSSFGTCMGAVLPSPETCANMGFDNDCNGEDDDVPGLGDPCMGTGVGVCGFGAQGCVGDELTCVTPDPVDETCDTRDEDCDGMTDEGFNLMDDRLNCGACNVACSDGFECCNGMCASLDTSATNCGACGTMCDPGDGCCGGTCFSIRDDEMNCGACGNVCGSGQTCCGGSCVDTSSTVTDCGGCGTSCSPSTTCCDGMCVDPSAPSCITCSPACTGGRVCCGGTCVDPMTDEAHCGGCTPPTGTGGVACGAMQVCCGGTCGPRDTASACGDACASCSALCCGGTCIPSDNMNCNACGVACLTGTCCPAGCTNLQTDDRNCGMCGRDCTTSGGHCSVGNCCPTGQTFCPGAGCVNFQSDNNHCGFCGNRCGILTSCMMGACRAL